MRELREADEEFEMRYMRADDEATVSRFARAPPAHDLLFMLLALKDGHVRGCAGIIRDELSWSPHVGEMRLVVDAAIRGKGLGRALMQECFAVALELGVEKLTAYMTADPAAAIAVFEDFGFHAEAMLSEHVRDRDGNKFLATMEILGAGNAE